MSVTTWQGCYDDSWRDLIVDDAFAHPAKFAPGLIRRIFQHGLDHDWWSPGSLIGDPFAGVGCGGVIAAGLALRWIGVELEPRFVELANRNFAKWKAIEPRPVILQGDSREFARLVGAVDSIVTSPPFVDSLATESAEFTEGRERGKYANRSVGDTYGSSPGQIGAMKPGKLEGIVTSPPYADSVKGQHGETETAKDSRDARNTPGGSLGQSQRHGGYGVSDGNIGNLPEGKLDGVVTSPPYEDSLTGKGGGIDWSKSVNTSLARTNGPQGFGGQGDRPESYGDTAGNLGNDSGDTYWEAVRAVYQQCRLALRPGGMLVVVVKDYIKAGQKVPLCDQTAALLESIGFETVERIRASLVAEDVSAGLWGEDVVDRKERKSFFRRLAEKKGSPPIDWEEVICVRKR